MILGIDPGSHHTGYGLVISQKSGLTLLGQGRFSPPASWPMARRLAHIHSHLSELISAYKPKAVAVEDIFYGKNVRSALKLGQVRGVVLLAAAQAEAEIFEYAPTAVKNTVAGYGRAEKSQVAHMVGELLKCKQILTADAADALAVAICHASQANLNSILPQRRSGASGGWRSLSLDEAAQLGYKAGK